jgi:hypothetical protein
MKTFRLIVICLSLLMLWGCETRGSFPSAQRDAPPVLPEYPGAINLQVQTLEPKTDGDRLLITFQTSDTSLEVKNFFDKELVVKGWEKFAVDRYYEKKACPIYGLFIIYQRTTPGLTDVELRLSPEVCRHR